MAPVVAPVAYTPYQLRYSCKQNTPQQPNSNGQSENDKTALTFKKIK
jgi:hypothetical protein